VRCDVCPRECKLQDGQRGLCFVRAAQGGESCLTTWGRSSGFCVDPIGKKTAQPFSSRNAGAVLRHRGPAIWLAPFCQNWDISKSRDIDRLADRATPEALAAAALKAWLPLGRLHL